MPERWFGNGIRLAVGTLAALTLGVSAARLVSSDSPQRLDPAAWGSDHVGQPIPQYITGDECLFCHREKVGPTWGANRHNLTIRAVDEPTPRLSAGLGALRQSSARDFADEIKFVMGDRRLLRFLKPAKSYGKLELLSVQWAPPRDKEPGTLISAKHPHWDATHFGKSCAGCHTTAVDPIEQAFSALSLDCYVCHGTVPPEHSKQTELVHLSAKRKDDARVVTSICAQCHVRTGTSRSTGRPYPNNFVAGDNLFRDFQIDFSDQGLHNLSTADRHVLENVRDVVVFGKEAVTCLNCHDVHGRSSKQHHRLPNSDYCLNCHDATGPKRNRKAFSTHSSTCGYEH